MNGCYHLIDDIAPEKRGSDKLTPSFDASEIDHWSDTAEAAHKLPELIRRLVLATLTEPPSSIDMPSGSSVRMSGWDGLLQAPQGNPWVPSGVSGWEFSCEKNVTRKANRVYETRTENPLSEDPATTTFVFVTPRRWSRKRQWERARQAEGVWLNVRAMDADDLVVWLEQSPEVTQWLSNEIHKQLFSIEQTNRLEQLHLESLDKITSGFSDVTEMKVGLQTLLAAVETRSEPDGSESTEDPTLQKWTDELDASRNLIQDGLILAAQQRLQRINDEANDLPDSLRFRLLTNLAVCAMGQNRLDEACSFFGEAYNIQPENPKAIANAALAAQISREPEHAVELAKKALAIDPSDSTAAATLMRALWDLEKIERLEEFVGLNDWLADDSVCASSLAGIRTQQSRFDEAIGLYRSLIDSNPDDAHARLNLSHCLLTYAQNDRLPIAYGKEALVMLQEAEAQANKAVELLQLTQLNVERREALVIRSGARALLGKLDEARNDLDAVLGEVPNHPEATLNKGLLLLKGGRPAEAHVLLESIEDPEVRAGALLPRADAYLQSGDASAAVSLLRGSFKLDPPGREDVGRAESLLLAEDAAGAEDSVGPALEIAMCQFPEDPGLLILHATRNNLRGDKEAAESALIRVIDLVDEPHRHAIQAQLGHLYWSMERFADAAAQFSEASGDDASHPVAVPMLISLVKSRQYRKALEFVEKIRELDEPPPSVVIEAEAGMLEYVGDATVAALRFEELCSYSDSTQYDRVRLAEAQFRCGEREAALQTAAGIDTSEFKDNPQALIQLAYLKRFLGTTGYLDDAYLARRYGQDDPVAHMGYFTLFQGLDNQVVDPQAVGPGCAVRIKNGEEEQWWYILEEGEESHGPQYQSLVSDFAQRLEGRRVGEIVEFRSGLEDLSYEVMAIQSKYVRAFQETAEEFSTRFPENLSLSRVRLDDDFSQVFQSIELRSQFVNNAEALYQTGQLPFASFCSLIGRSALEVWPEYIMQPSARIHFGSSAAREVMEAGELLDDATDVVLDMVALLTVHRLGVAEHLQKRFSRATVPQMVYDELQNVVNTMRMSRPPVGHMGKDEEGLYTHVELPEDDWLKRLEYAESVLELADSFERIPSYLLLDANEPGELMVALTPAGAGAVLAGDKLPMAKQVLVSDDRLQSDIARSLGVGTVNTQLLLFELARTEVITYEEYSSYVEDLARMNYWYVRIGPQDILQRLEASHYRITDSIRSMLRSLRGPDCSEAAAASVAAEIIASIAKKSLMQHLGEQLLSLLISEMRSGRHSNHVLIEFKREITVKLSLAPIQCARILRAVDLYMRV